MSLVYFLVVFFHSSHLVEQGTRGLGMNTFLGNAAVVIVVLLGIATWVLTTSFGWNQCRVLDHKLQNTIGSQPWMNASI